MASTLFMLLPLVCSSKNPVSTSLPIQRKNRAYLDYKKNSREKPTNYREAIENSKMLTWHTYCVQRFLSVNFFPTPSQTIKSPRCRKEVMIPTAGRTTSTTHTPFDLPGTFLIINITKKKLLIINKQDKESAYLKWIRLHQHAVCSIRTTFEAG